MCNYFIGDASLPKIDKLIYYSFSNIYARRLWDSRLSPSLYHYSHSRRPGARHTTPGSRRVAEHLVRPLPLASACSAPRRKLQIRAPGVFSTATTCPVARTADSSQTTEQRGGRRVRYKQLQTCYLSLLRLQIITIVICLNIL